MTSEPPGPPDEPTQVVCPKCDGNPFEGELAERCGLCDGTGLVDLGTRRRWLEERKDRKR